MKKPVKIEVGDVVAFNTLDDAVWFDVIRINRTEMIVREHGTNYAEQISDTSLVKQVRRV